FNLVLLRLTPELIHRARQPFNRWDLKDTSQRNVGSQSVADSSYYLRSRQRVSAEKKEVVFCADPFDRKHLFEDVRNGRFDFVGRSYILLLKNLTVVLGRGQRVAINLSV